ncbi:MAG: cation:proton antiporter, partial [bacterium]
MTLPATLVIGIIIFTGFICGELARKIKLPKVTGYILAGILLNPGFFPFIPGQFVAHTELITNISLAVITFSIGGMLFSSRLKKLGKGILYITLAEAEGAFLAVVAGFLIMTPLLIHFLGAEWAKFFLPVSLVIGAMGSPTDPSATLAVMLEYHAKGDVSSTIMGVAAFDDALGIMNYSLALAAANVLLTPEGFTLTSALLKPSGVILGGLALGIAFGLGFNLLTLFIKKETEGVFIVVILSLLLLCFGCAALLGLDELLATMMMGVVVVNFNKSREKIFQILERYTDEFVFVLFFTISGMHLNLASLSTLYIPVVLFVVFRALGKFMGTMMGASLAKSSPAVRKYTAGGLIPQGGIVVGLALMARQNPALKAMADTLISIIIGAT